MKLMINFDAGMPVVRWRDDRSIAFSDLRFLKSNVLECFPTTVETSTAMPPKRGRKMKFDWPDVREFVFKTMDEKREFQEWDAEWKCQADLERLITAYMGKRQEHPIVTTVRVYVSKYLKEWRAVQTGSLPAFVEVCRSSWTFPRDRLPGGRPLEARLLSSFLGWLDKHLNDLAYVRGKKLAFAKELQNVCINVCTEH
jgi:hypothetical protein